MATDKVAQLSTEHVVKVPWPKADEYVLPLPRTRNESEPWADTPKDANGNFVPWAIKPPSVPKKTPQDQAGKAIDDALRRELEKRVSPDSKTPLPLTHYVKRKSEFPVDALCTLLKDATNGIIDTIQCPKALAAMSVLGTASLAVQGHADVISPATGHAKPLSLFLLTNAESGERKTSADTEALKPATEWEKQLDAIYANEFPRYRNRFDAWDSERTHILRNKSLTAEKRVYALTALGPQPQVPLNPMLTCSEPTIEGLYSLFLKGQPSLGLFSSEGGQFIGGHGMNDDARIRTGGALCSLWDGETVKRVRASKDETYSLSGRRLAMHLMVQPIIAEQFLSMKDLEGQGLFSRILVSYPESTIGTRKQHIKDPLTDQSMYRYWAQLYQVFKRPLPLAQGKLNELCPRALAFDIDAVALWMEYADSIEALQVAGGVYENIRGFAGKMAENASRIAGVMTLVENLEATTISKSSLNNAITIMNYFGEQALAMFESSRICPDMLNAEKLLNWLRNQWTENYINVRTVIDVFQSTKLRRMLLTISTTQQPATDLGYPLPQGSHFEVDLVDLSMMWRGRADLITVTSAGCGIVDWKTGQESEDHHRQIQIYALLWDGDSELNPSHLPTESLILSYDGMTVDVAVPNGEQLIESKRMLCEGTEKVRAELELDPVPARPSTDNCRFCQVKLMCNDCCSWNQSSIEKRDVFTDLELVLIDAPNESSWIAESNLKAVGMPTVLLKRSQCDDGLWSALQPGIKLRMSDAMVTFREDGEQPLVSFTTFTEALLLAV